MSTVVITGGSRGIGAAAVTLFASRGHSVYFLYEKNHAAAAAVAEKTGATPICCDVADSRAVKAAFSQIPDVDILVCNAGIMHFGLLSMMEEEAWDRLFAVNVKGIYNCVNAAMPAFLRKHSGSIITVSSMWGQVGASCEAAYSATKGAVIALTKALAKELGPSGIRVNCVAPGVILTEMCAGVDPEVLAMRDKWYDHPAFAKYEMKKGIERCQRESDEFLASLGYEHIPGTGTYKAVAPNDDRVALFAHQGFGLTFLSCMLDIPYPQFSVHFDMSHTGMTVIDFKNENGIVIPRVLTLANDSHLYKEGLPTRYHNNEPVF